MSVAKVNNQIKSEYRPDIDGLRAIAVLSVLFFHADIPALTGGYVGVDIFFVISGYLITSILVREIERGEYSVIRFYERRFRRLLPALFTVVLFVMVVGVLILHPRDLLDLGQSAIATSVFSSNILFNLESGYFDGPADFKPLLHTWSLGVEEQFYILFPLLLLAVSKIGLTTIRIAIVVLFICSFALCVYGTPVYPTASFYLLPSRAWELLAGSILAINLLPRLTGRAVAEVLSLVGIVCIAVSLFFFNRETVFPGVAAALPVLGAMLVIYSGASSQVQTTVGSFLSIRPMVFIGLISYSLYLWHWPILVYFKYLTVGELNLAQVLLAMAVIFLLSIVSWRFVETPFRRKNWFGTPRKLFSVAAVASAVMLVFGLVAVVSHGLPNRYGYASEGYAQDGEQWNKWGICQAKMNKRLSADDGLCAIGGSGDSPRFLLWGDSHARSLAPAVELSGKNSKVLGRVATRGACPPLLGIDRPGRTSCAKFNQSVLEYLKRADDIELVILAGRWTLAATGSRYKMELGTSVVLTDLQTADNGTKSNEVQMEAGLRRTVTALRDLGKEVLIVTQIPEVGYDVPSIDFLSKAGLGDDPNQLVSPTRVEYQQRNQSVIKIFESVSDDLKFEVADPLSVLCAAQKCRVVENGHALYLDDNHLTIYGSEFVASVFDVHIQALDK